jgi:hypothetical protein
VKRQPLPGELEGQQHRLRVVRLDASGKPLGGLALPANISSTPTAGVVGLASDGQGFLVAWEDMRNNPLAPPPPTQPPPPMVLDIYAARIADDGTLLDASGFQVAGGTSTKTAPAAAFDGTNYLVTWVEQSTIRGVRVDRSSALVDTASFLVGGNIMSSSVPAAVWGKDRYLVTWLSSSGPMCRRLDATGKMLDASEVLVPLDSLASFSFRSVHAAWNGRSFLVGWTGRDANGGIAMAARVGTDGARTDGNGFFIEPPVDGESPKQADYPSMLGLAGDSSGH